MMSLIRPEPLSMRVVVLLPAMDPTTLTAALKPLRRRGLLRITRDPSDKAKIIRGADSTPQRPLRDFGVTPLATPQGAGESSSASSAASATIAELD